MLQTISGKYPNFVLRIPHRNKRIKFHIDIEKHHAQVEEIINSIVLKKDTMVFFDDGRRSINLLGDILILDKKGGKFECKLADQSFQICMQFVFIQFKIKKIDEQTELNRERFNSQIELLCLQNEQLREQNKDLRSKIEPLRYSFIFSVLLSVLLMTIMYMFLTNIHSLIYDHT